MFTCAGSGSESWNGHEIMNEVASTLEDAEMEALEGRRRLGKCHQKMATADAQLIGADITSDTAKKKKMGQKSQNQVP